jgi:hypothetical protein
MHHRSTWPHQPTHDASGRWPGHAPGVFGARRQTFELCSLESLQGGAWREEDGEVWWWHQLDSRENFVGGCLLSSDLLSRHIS